MTDYQHINSDYIDDYALANVLDDSARRNRQAKYALRHKPTGKYLKSDSKSYWSRYYLTDSDPSIKPMSAMTLWLKRMRNPDDWEVVTMERMPVDDATRGELYAALGIMSAIKGDMVVNVDDPIGMAQAVYNYVEQLKAINKWHDAPELPPGPGMYLAVWGDDGCWAAQYWPNGISGMTGEEYEEGEDGVSLGVLGNWATPDGSIRTDPLAWRYLPHVPEKYTKQISMFAEEVGNGY